MSTLWSIAITNLDEIGQCLTTGRPVVIRDDQTKMLMSLHEKSKVLQPVKSLPNVKRFQVKALSNYHPVLEAAGIRKRIHSPLVESENYRNGRLNRYVDHQILRLNSSRSNPRKFWSIAQQLMRSNSYLVTCFNNVNPGWHRNMKYGEVLKIIQSIRNLDVNKYEYKIVNIPKGDSGETRPLGVPTNAWRVYLHAWNNILLIYLSLWIPEMQHGFYPGRGTKSAWDQVYKEVLASKNIYEFDLRKFFDSLNLDYLHKMLLSVGVHPTLAATLINCSRTAPQKGKEPQTFSSQHENVILYKYHKSHIWGIYDSWELDYWKWQLQEESKFNPRVLCKGYYCGVSQGAPTSPLLSTLMLIPTLMLSSLYKIVQYADDGILYDYTSLPSLRFPPETGITIHPQKSEEIRREGVWLKPLKFLGQVYLPESLLPEGLILTPDNDTCGGIIMNKTRTPKDFSVDQLQLIKQAVD